MINNKSFLMSALITLIVIFLSLFLFNWMSKEFLGLTIPYVVFIVVLPLSIISTIVPGYFHFQKSKKLHCNFEYNQRPVKKIFIVSSIFRNCLKILSYLGMFSIVPFLILKKKPRTEDEELIFFHSSQGLALTVIRYLITLIALGIKWSYKAPTQHTLIDTIFIILISFIAAIIAFSIFGWIMLFKRRQVALFGISWLAEILRQIVNKT